MIKLACPESGETFGQFSFRLKIHFRRFIDLSKTVETFDDLVHSNF